MQREIEKLLIAHHDEKHAEIELIKRLMSALALGSSARQRMFDDIHATVADIGSKQGVTEHRDKPVPADIDQAVLQFRRAQSHNLDA